MAPALDGSAEPLGGGGREDAIAALKRNRGELRRALIRAGEMRFMRRVLPRGKLISELVEAAALQHEPHQLAHYLRELANEFHTYYNAHQFLVDSEPLRNARLNLIQAVRQVIANGLGLLGVSAPESM